MTAHKILEVAGHLLNIHLLFRKGREVVQCGSVTDTENPLNYYFLKEKELIWSPWKSRAYWVMGMCHVFLSLWEDSWWTEHDIQASLTMVKILEVSLPWTLRTLKLCLSCRWWDGDSGICRGLSQLQEQTEINVISFHKDRHEIFCLWSDIQWLKRVTLRMGE